MDSTESHATTPHAPPQSEGEALPPIVTNSSTEKLTATGQIDVGAIIAEVEALAKMAGAAASPSNDTAAGTSVAALEREIEAMMSGASGASSGGLSGGDSTDGPAPRAVDFGMTPSAPTASSIAESSIQSETMDPLLLEINAILDDTNESIISTARGDLDGALRVVFDPRALSGQEEDVNAALIEAFGSTRRSDAWRVLGLPTNPTPKFAGVAREIPKDVPREEFEPEAAAAAPSLVSAPVLTPVRTFEEIGAQASAKEAPAEYAGETPFEPAFPSVPINDAPTPVAPATPLAVAAATAVAAVAAVATAVVAATEPTPATPSTPKPLLGARVRALVHTITEPCVSLLLKLCALPLQCCAFPMRCLPETAKQVMTVAALSMVIVVPLAWWMASTSAAKPGIGRVEFPKPAPAAAAEEPAAAADAGHGGGGGGH